jgi:hypothetical protein
MQKTTKQTTWPSKSKSSDSDFIGSLTSVITPQPLKELLFPRSLDLNISFEIKYRR